MTCHRIVGDSRNLGQFSPALFQEFRRIQNVKKKTMEIPSLTEHLLVQDFPLMDFPASYAWLPEGIQMNLRYGHGNATAKGILFATKISGIQRRIRMMIMIVMMRMRMRMRRTMMAMMAMMISNIIIVVIIIIIIMIIIVIIVFVIIIISIVIIFIIYNIYIYICYSVLSSSLLLSSLLCWSPSSLRSEAANTANRVTSALL